SVVDFHHRVTAHSGQTKNTAIPVKTADTAAVILNTNKKREKICAEIQYKTVFNSYKIVGLIFSIF
ncbi:MAG: hypothetical protein ACI4J6_08805, partial [Oscillospiraceae bacterium]